MGRVSLRELFRRRALGYLSTAARTNSELRAQSGVITAQQRHVRMLAFTGAGYWPLCIMALPPERCHGAVYLVSLIELEQA